MRFFPAPTTPLLLLLAGVSSVHAQQKPTPTSDAVVDAKAFTSEPPGIYGQADLSYVLTSGNSSSSSLGFKGSLERRTLHHSFGLEVGGLRASSSSGERVAIGTPEEYELESPRASPTAEAYYARGRYDYKTRARLYITTGGGWERNRYSGIEDRWVLDVGLGYAFVARERTLLRAALGATYTDEDYAAADPGHRAFVGARLSWDASHRLLETTTVQHTLILDQSLEEASSRRADAQLALQVAMTEKLSLKLSWRVLLNNQPPLVEVPLVSREGAPSDATVLAPYGKLDQGLSISLVLNMAPARKP